MFSSYAYIYIHKIKEMFVYIYIISGSIRCFPCLQDLARLKIALKHFGPRPKKFAGPCPRAFKLLKQPQKIIVD